MSTTVTAGAGGANGTIKFEYTIASILEEVESATANIASKMDEKDIEALDKYSLTADENFHFMNYLKDAHSSVIRVLKGLTFGIDTPFVLDETKVSYTVVNKAAYNANILPVCDNVISTAIRNFIIKEWFLQCGLKDWAEYFNAKYQESLRMIAKYSIELRKGQLV